MLKQLRRKIVMINVSLISLVLIAGFFIFCVNSYHFSRRELEQGLYIALKQNPEKNGQEPAGSSVGGAEDGGKRHFTVATISVLVEDGEICQVFENGATMELSLLQAAVDKALEHTEACGILKHENLMYARKACNGTTRLAFADTAPLFAHLRRDILISAGLCLVSIAALFAVSFLLSRFALRPVEDAWIRQKQLIADASHELKTPLTVILANNNILLSGALGSAQELQWLESTDAEAQKMRQLLEQMLLLARSDAEQARPVLEQVDLSELIQEQMLFFEPVAYEKGISIVGTLPEQLVCTTDRSMFTRLVQVLMENAVQYGAPGSEIRIGLSGRAQHAQLSVRDFGECIPPEELTRVFDRFFRADKARSGGGFGLGLAIAKNIADVLHLRLSAESSEQEGTCFTISW